MDAENLASYTPNESGLLQQRTFSGTHSQDGKLQAGYFKQAAQ
jgi:hypothetical protein